MRHTTLVIFLGFAAAPAIGADLTVFGYELGAPIRAEACTHEILPFALPPAPCVTSLERKFPFAGSWRRLYFAAKTEPTYVVGSNLTLIEEMPYAGGPLLGVMFETLGYPVQDSILETLTKKYGKPGSASTFTLQNGFGAKYDVLVAEWRSADLVVHFDGVTSSDLHSGQVFIGTPKAEELRRAAQRPAASAEKQL